MNRLAALGAIALTTTLLTGCVSGTGGSSDAEASDTAMTITVATAPSLVGMPVQLALDLGYFADEGLDVELVTATSPAEQAPLLLSGEVPFIYSSVHDTLLAAGQGMPFQLVVPMAMSAPAGLDGAGFGNLIVAADGDIEEPADLEGRTVGVTSIGSVSYMDHVMKLEQLGVDVDAVQWVEVPVQRSVAALNQGQVDAVTSSEPFGTIAVEAGDARFLYSTDDVIPEICVLGLVTSQEYASQHPDVVQGVANAVLRANAYATEHPEKIQELAAPTFEISPELAALMHTPTYPDRPFQLEDVVPQRDRIERFDSEAPLPDPESILLDAEIRAGITP
ncbi:MAG: ABC transporter substrate-binding protein [Pseudoclavibacter sp.]